MNVKQYEKLIENVLDEAELYSQSAYYLLLGTAAQESGFSYIAQLGAGPAKSFMQIEPASAFDNVFNYINFRDELRGRIWRTSQIPEDFLKRSIDKKVELIEIEKMLERNMAFSILQARIKYFRVPHPIPSNIQGMAKYWKQHYNTEWGAGTEEEFLKNYGRYGLTDL